MRDMSEMPKQIKAVAMALTRLEQELPGLITSAQHAQPLVPQYLRDRLSMIVQEGQHPLGWLKAPPIDEVKRQLTTTLTCDTSVPFGINGHRLSRGRVSLGAICFPTVPIATRVFTMDTSVASVSDGLTLSIMGSDYAGHRPVRIYAVSTPCVVAVYPTAVS